MKKRSRQVLSRTASWARALGLYPRLPRAPVASALQLVRDYRQYARMQSAQGEDMPLDLSFPCLNDRQATSGSARGHYFHQDLLVAQQVFARAPRRHIDVGSRVDGFVTHVASFREIEVIDIRPNPASVRNITFRVGDLTDAETLPVEACDSLSCLHALEHVGLGRYGDRIDPLGHVVALRNLAKMLESSGTLYLSFPIGQERIEFNAHRVFSAQRARRLVEESFEIVRFWWVDDRGDLMGPLPQAKFTNDISSEQNFALAILELTRRTRAAGGATPESG